MLAISLVTLGDPDQLTGGYLYHRRMAELAPAHDAEIRFVSFPDLPFPIPVGWSSAVLRSAWGADVVVLDSIATAFAGPRLVFGPPPVPLAVLTHQPLGGIDHGHLRRRLQSGLDRLAYWRAEVVVAASAALSDNLVAQGIARRRLIVVPPGKDVDELPAGPVPELRSGRRAALLCVGNWVERKGILPLLDAFARLPAGAATLHLVGRDDADAGYARRVRARLARPDLAGRVVVHGAVSRAEAAALYGGADIFVLPATREPYGTVYGEAMAAGLPVVGWRAGNLAHLATDGREGLLAEPGDEAGLAVALLRLVDDEAYRQQMGRAARRRAESFPTWAESAAVLFGALRDLASRR
jgi:glycosyltransferase involved in cell wall biosynthesis